MQVEYSRGAISGALFVIRHWASYADAVLLHFTPEEAAAVARKIYGALADGGIFGLRMKQGDGAVWSDEKLGEPRYFYYWQVESLQTLLTGAGFEWVSMAESYTGHNSAKWMHVILRKNR